MYGWIEIRCEELIEQACFGKKKVTWPLDKEYGRLVRGLTDFIMDQNFLGSLLQSCRKLNKEVFLGITDVGYNFVSQVLHFFVFTEPALGVAFLIALVKQFTLQDVLVNFPIDPSGA